MRDIINILSMDRIKASDLKLDRMARRISFNSVNPLNADSEMRKFMKDTSYNPWFTYAPLNYDAKKLKEEIRSVKTDRSVAGRILSDIKLSLADHLMMMDARGSPTRFTRASIKIFGAPDRKLISTAKKLITLETPKEKKIYSAKDVITKFKLAFLEYGFPWDVLEKDMIANAAVDCSGRKLFIKKGARFSKSFVKRLIVHEIGTHAMRKENGAMQPYTFFERGFPGYLMTEEGLAVINEEMNDCLDNRTLKIYAGRVIAIDAALKGSFAKTYASLVRHFGKMTAWRLALRAKRGLSDTSKKGACTKDINYLKGYLEIKRYLKNGGDINLLYYGKIGVQHVGVISRMNMLINPRVLPMFRHTNFLIQHFSRILKTIIFLDIEPGIRFINRRIRRTMGKELIWNHIKHIYTAKQPPLKGGGGSRSN